MPVEMGAVVECDIRYGSVGIAGKRRMFRKPGKDLLVADLALDLGHRGVLRVGPTRVVRVANRAGERLDGQTGRRLFRGHPEMILRERCREAQFQVCQPDPRAGSSGA